MKYNLALTPDQINVIFAALGKMPFETVFNLINELNDQLKSQVLPSNTEENSDSR